VNDSRVTSSAVPGLDRGLDEDGYIRREGSLSRVQRSFVPVVEAARERCTGVFTEERLHSAYLFGSIPRGRAIPAASDLDLALALQHEPTDADREDADRLAGQLNAAFPQVDGVDITLYHCEAALREAERHDLGWTVACLCTPLTDADLADHLPRYRPTSELARETNGDLSRLLPVWQEQVGRAVSKRQVHRASRVITRKLTRTGFTLVMPRWNGWTSDLMESAAAFGHYYPERAEQMDAVARLARLGRADLPVLTMIIEDLGPWLAAEYTDLHGEKTSRSPVLH
jgi:uncharacterized protein